MAQYQVADTSASIIKRADERLYEHKKSRPRKAEDATVSASRH
jgi:hypothetical protein